VLVNFEVFTSRDTWRPVIEEETSNEKRQETLKLAKK